MKGKDLRKQWKQVGLGLGFGLVVGKYLGLSLTNALDYVSELAIKRMAGKGDEFSKDYCDKVGWSYDKPENKEPEDEE